MAQPKPILKTWLENEASAYKRFHEDLLEEHDRPGQNMLLLKDLNGSKLPSGPSDKKLFWFEFCDGSFRIDVFMQGLVIHDFSQRHKTPLNLETYPKQLFDVEQYRWMVASPPPAETQPGQSKQRPPPRLCLQVTRIRLHQPKAEPYTGPRAIKKFIEGSSASTKEWIAAVLKKDSDDKENALKVNSARAVKLREFQEAEGPPPLALEADDDDDRPASPKAEKVAQGAQKQREFDFVTTGSLEEVLARAPFEPQRLWAMHASKLDVFYEAHPELRPVPNGAGKPAFPRTAPPVASTSRLPAASPSPAPQPARRASTPARPSPCRRSSRSTRSPSREIKQDKQNKEAGPTSLDTKKEEAKARSSSPQALTAAVDKGKGRATSVHDDATAPSNTSPSHRQTSPPISSAYSEADWPDITESPPRPTRPRPPLSRADTSFPSSFAQPPAGQVATASFRASQWLQEPVIAPEVSLGVTSQAPGQPMGGQQQQRSEAVDESEEGQSGESGAREVVEEQEQEVGCEADRLGGEQETSSDDDQEMEDARTGEEDVEMEEAAPSSPARAPWEAEEDEEEEEQPSQQVMETSEVEDSQQKGVEVEAAEIEAPQEMLSQPKAEPNDDGNESEATTSSMTTSSDDEAEADSHPLAAVHSQVRAESLPRSQGPPQPSPHATTPSQSLTHVSESQPSAPATQALSAAKRPRAAEVQKPERRKKRALSPLLGCFVKEEDEETIPPTPNAESDLSAPAIRVYVLPKVKKVHKLPPCVTEKVEQWKLWDEKQRSWETERGVRT